ncbi:MAG TPA: cytidine deaminase [Gemmatales bacterium]|nr:cytidine deaminase [Gemmatales bacterium]HMP16823.1 cytidine deaminase [Gemmatales bacterium]
MKPAELLGMAEKAREFARCPYSGFAVGAALLTKEGKVFTGCNIENASYGLTVCAERVALVKALSEGEVHFSHIAIFTAAEVLTPPCGPCRQLLWEYAGNLLIILGNSQGNITRYRLSKLLPHPFDGKNLQ